MFKDGLLRGKRILVTGGGTGLGRVMTERYLELGAEVYICGRRGSVLADAAAEMAAIGTVHTRTVDIHVAAAVDDMIDGIFAEGPLHGLVNNAAGNFISPTEALSPRAFDAIANIVLHGTFYVTNACGRRWIAGGHKASVISIVVTWVWTGSAYVVPSAMSKAGIAAMTKSLAVEWAPKGIRLNAIAPGPFPTKGASARLMPNREGLRSTEDSVPIGRAGEPAELANLATFLMADGCDYLTGEVLAIDGGQWLNGAGTFANLKHLDPGDWTAIRDRIKAANDADKASRG